MSMVASFRRPLAILGLKLRPPAGLVGSTRWLMAVLALFTVLNSIPAVLMSSHGAFLVVGMVSAGALLASTCLVYAGRRIPFLDLVDAVALFGFALSCTEAAAVFNYMFAAVWFRGFDGLFAQRILRPTLYLIALLAAFAVWPLNPSHVVPPTVEPVIGFFPVLLVTAIIAGRLGTGLLGQKQGLRRDAILAAAGVQMLALRNGASIRSASWQAMTELCVASPGLRIVRVERVGSELTVTGRLGTFTALPESLPDHILTTSTDGGAGTLLDAAALNSAAGTVLTWECFRFGANLEESWILVGNVKTASTASMLAVTSLLNQTILALRNGDVYTELTVQARIDALTGLANRSDFTRELTTLLLRRDRAREVHLLFLDLDDFKDVNDLLGHRAGDELLTEVSLRLRSCTRPGDLCARLGGDEFAVVLATATKTEAEAVAQRIVDSVGEPMELGGRTARVGVSIGISSSTPGIDVDDFVHQADVAMYAAKAHGKGRIELFHGELLQADTSRLAFEREIAAAAAAGELVVHYQPVLALPGLECTAIEAFLRWQHPTRGLLLPVDFIDAADRIGAIVDIGNFVLQRACADAVRWSEGRSGSPLELHLTISDRQLASEGFFAAVQQCLEQGGIPANLVVLQLTERVLMNSPIGLRHLVALTELGIRIAVGQFGNGYSSFATLRSLPIDIIKLDAEFLAAALVNPVDRSVLTAVVELSTTELGLRVIADGVERPEQQQFLADLGTDAVQGSMYSRPLPAAELTSWLQRNHTEHARGDQVVSILRARRTPARRQSPVIRRAEPSAARPPDG